MNDLRRLARLIETCKSLNIYFQYKLGLDETRMWIGNDMKANKTPFHCDSIEQIEHYVKEEIKNELKNIEEDSKIIDEKIQCYKAYLHMLG